MPEELEQDEGNEFDYYKNQNEFQNLNNEEQQNY